MKEMNSLSLLAVVSLLGIFIGGCGDTPKDDKNNQSGWHLSDDKSPNNSTGYNQNAIEEEGPQYQQPTMEVLQGKPQKFPAKYPVGRYPRSTVALVDVRANRPPGYLNQVMLKTVDNIPQVGAYYQQKMQAEQWTKVSEVRNEIYDSTKWEKGDLRCEVRVAQDFSHPDGRRFIQLLYGLKAKKRNFKQQPMLPPPSNGSTTPNGAPVTNINPASSQR